MKAGSVEPLRKEPSRAAEAGRARLAWLLLALLASLSLSNCHRPGDNRIPGYLHLRLDTNPTTLDPARITDVQGGDLAAKIFNGLVRLDERLDVVPDIAQSWRLSKDKRTYTFRLRKGVRFSSGRTVTAHDFRYSFERILTPETKAPLTWVLDKIQGAHDFLAGTAPRVTGIRVVDDYTLALTLEKPFGPFLSLLVMPTAYVVPKEDVERLGHDFGNQPVGSGPFLLADWKHGQSLLFQAREDYFETGPRVKGMYYRIIPEDLTAVMEFETGGLDVLLIPASEYRRYKTDPRWIDAVYAKPGLNTYYIGLNCTRPPFQDARVRRAVNMAIDRKRILDTIYERRGIVAAGPIPRGLWKHNAQPKNSDGYGYEPEQAKALIREAGMEGRTIKIFFKKEQDVQDIMEVIQRYLTEAGLKPELRQLDWSALKHAVNMGEPDAFWLSWWADYPDPENFLFPLFHSGSVGPAGNRTRCLDPDLDRLIEVAQGTVDEAKRYRLYRQAEDRVIRNAPWVFMWHKTEYYVVQPWVQNFKTYPIYSIDKGVDVGILRER